MIEIARDQKEAKKWQRAMLKVFREIAKTYKDKPEFHLAAEEELNK